MVINAWCSLKGHIYLKKHVAFESVFNKITGLQTCNFIKKRLQHSMFVLDIKEINCKHNMREFEKINRTNHCRYIRYKSLTLQSIYQVSQRFRIRFLTICRQLIIFYRIQPFNENWRKKNTKTIITKWKEKRKRLYIDIGSNNTNYTYCKLMEQRSAERSD